MANKALILASSGSGKSTSLRRMNPKDCVVIQPIVKNLPFPGNSDWKRWETGKGGSIITLENTETVITFLDHLESNYPDKKVIIIDDAIYLMANQMMDDINDKSYDKWVLIADQFYRLIRKIRSMSSEKRVYIMTHPDEDANGVIKMKTVGSLTDKALTPLGLFDTVLGASFRDGKYKFLTKKMRASDPYKSPVGMFKDIEIDNDLYRVDSRMCKLSGIENDHVPIELNEDMTPKHWTKEQIDSFWEE